MSKNALVTLTVILCIAAAGVGGYLATKSGVSSRAIEAPASAAAPAPAAPVVSAPPAAELAQQPVRAWPSPESASLAPAPASEVAPRDAVRPVAPAGDLAGATRKAPARKPTPAKVEAAVPAVTAPQAPAAAPTDAPVVPAPIAAPPNTQVVTPPADPTPVAPVPVEREPQFDEVEVEADSVLGIQIDSTVHSETARIEDPVEAHVSRDLRVGSLVAIPAGSRVLGVVTQIERGGKMKSKARLAIRFHTLVLADGTRTTIQSEPVFREGEGPGQEAAGKVGAAAAGGALLGAILGGKRGAIIGGSVGAAGGTAAVMAGDRNAAILKAGTSVTIRLLRPVTVMVAR